MRPTTAPSSNSRRKPRRNPLPPPPLSSELSTSITISPASRTASGTLSRTVAIGGRVSPAGGGQGNNQGKQSAQRVARHQDSTSSCVRPLQPVGRARLDGGGVDRRRRGGARRPGSTGPAAAADRATCEARSRRLVGPRPLPRWRCAAHAATGGASSTAAISHRSSTSVRVHARRPAPTGSRRPPRRPRPRSPASGRPPGSSGGAGRGPSRPAPDPRRPARRGRPEGRRSGAWRSGPGARPRRSTPRVDEAAGHQRRARRVVADEGDQAVEVLPEPGRRRGQVAQAAVPAGDAERAGPRRRRR